jgi:hypothetical protein
MKPRCRAAAAASAAPGACAKRKCRAAAAGWARSCAAVRDSPPPCLTSPPPALPPPAPPPAGVYISTTEESDNEVVVDFPGTYYFMCQEHCAVGQVFRVDVDPSSCLGPTESGGEEGGEGDDFGPASPPPPPPPELVPPVRAMGTKRWAAAAGGWAGLQGCCWAACALRARPRGPPGKLPPQGQAASRDSRRHAAALSRSPPPARAVAKVRAAPMPSLPVVPPVASNALTTSQRRCAPPPGARAARTCASTSANSSAGSRNFPLGQPVLLLRHA